MSKEMDNLPIINNSNSSNSNSTSTSNGEEQDHTYDSRKLKSERRLIEIRRAKVLELWSQGLSQTRIAEELHISQPTVNADIIVLRKIMREQIKTFIVDRLPITVSKAFTTLDLITQKLWQTVAQAEKDGDEKLKMQALSLIKDTEADKIEIVSNVGIVDSIITTAEGQQSQQLQQPQPQPQKQTISPPSEDEENAIASEYIRDTKYQEEDEDQPKAEESE